MNSVCTAMLDESSSVSIFKLFSDDPSPKPHIKHELESTGVQDYSTM